MIYLKSKEHKLLKISLPTHPRLKWYGGDTAGQLLIHVVCCLRLAVRFAVRALMFGSVRESCSRGICTFAPFAN